MHIALGSEPQTLDPHVASGSQEYQLIAALFEPLVSIDPTDLAFEPAAAERWEYDSDGLGATFFLRRDGRWSNGDPVTAHDFVFAWRRAVNPRLGNQLAEIFFHLEGARSLYRAESDDFSRLGARALDDYTLRLEFEYPLPLEALLLNVSHMGAVPVHRGSLLEHGAEAARYSGWAKPGALYGNGPFVLDSWRFQRDLRISRSPTYWDTENVALEGLVFHPVNSVATQEKLFRSGQIHVTSGLPSSKLGVYGAIAASPLVNEPIMRSEYFAVNLQRSPLADVRVRRALALAIDREALARPVYSGAATAMGRYLPPGLLGYEPPEERIAFDPETARKLFVEAGFPGGAGFPELELLAASGESGRALSTAVLQMWSDVLGIKVRAVNQEYQVYLDSLVGGDFDLVLASWSGGSLPSGFLDRWVTGGGTNDSRFSNAAFDRLIEVDSRSTADLTELMTVYREAEAILLRELPIIPLFRRHDTFLKQPCVQGMPVNPLGVVDLKRVALAPMQAWQMPEGMEFAQAAGH
ncbi:MAG: peptide ABC transporter substrate-binding protein [Halieaceae bacterium]|nr:peptide ABC transporter substrate-binding protein [Halieaceae bacterium]